LEDLQPEVRGEPRLALDGGAAGLAIIRRLVHSASEHLADGGWLLMEIGAHQEAAASAMAHAASLRQVSVCPDYAGLPRVLVARR
jgi:release factor glutamine methyltransferase